MLKGSLLGCFINLFRDDGFFPSDLPLSSSPTPWSMHVKLVYASTVRDSGTWNYVGRIQFPEIKKKCGDTAKVVYCRSRMWHPLVRSSLSEWPRKPATVYLMHSVLKASCPVEVNQLAILRGGGGRVVHAKLWNYESCSCSHAWKGEFRADTRRRWIIVEISWVTGRP